MRFQQPQTQSPKQNPQLSWLVEFKAFQLGQQGWISCNIYMKFLVLLWIDIDDDDDDDDVCMKLLTPSCCPFPRAKAEEELWTHSNEQSEVAQREAPKGPSKNKSWPRQKTIDTKSSHLSDEEHMLSSCKSPNRGLEQLQSVHAFNAFSGSNEKRKNGTHTHTQKRINTRCFTPGTCHSFSQGTAFLQRWHPAVVCALAESAWCAHAHWSEIASNNKHKAHQRLCFYLYFVLRNEEAKSLWTKTSVCHS